MQLRVTRHALDTDSLQESVILFLKMRPGKIFHSSLIKDVKEAIARGLSRRHVPKYVFETPEIPVCTL